MKVLLPFLFVFFCFTSFGQDNPVEDKMYDGVYQIIIPDLDTTTHNIGTGFIINYRNEQFVITVRHLMPKEILLIPKDGMSFSTLYILKGNGMERELDGDFIFIKHLDIAVAKVKSKDIQLLAINKKYMENLSYIRRGDYAIFTGYPVITSNGVPYAFCTTLQDGNCYPFLKVGRLSGFNTYSTSNNSFYIDAMNSTGFSGSPVFMYDNEIKQFVLGGIVHSYLLQEVIQTDPNGTQQQVPNISANSGLTQGVFMSYVYTMIDAYIFKDSL